MGNYRQVVDNDCVWPQAIQFQLSVHIYHSGTPFSNRILNCFSSPHSVFPRPANKLKRNGEGYPGLLLGDQISIFARIVSIADAFDALTSTRPYRRGVVTAPAVEALKAEHGSQFDARLLDDFIQVVGLNALQVIVGTCERGVRMVVCPTCGPVISVSGNARDGDIVCCRICGNRHRLHRDGDTFVVEPTGAKGTAEDLKPRPETGAIDALISHAPQWIDI